VTQVAGTFVLKRVAGREGQPGSEGKQVAPAIELAGGKKHWWGFWRLSQRQRADAAPNDVPQVARNEKGIDPIATFGVVHTCGAANTVRVETVCNDEIPNCIACGLRLDIHVNLLRVIDALKRDRQFLDATVKNNGGNLDSWDPPLEPREKGFALAVAKHLADRPLSSAKAGESSSKCSISVVNASQESMRESAAGNRTRGESNLDDSVDRFQFRVTDGKLDIRMNLWGHFSMLYESFRIAVSNISDNVEKIVMPDDPVAEREARSRHAYVLGRVRTYLDRDVFEKGFAMSELGPNEAIARFNAIRETLNMAATDPKLLATESTCVREGFTGLLNDLLGTRQNVARAVAEASRLSDDELIKRICEDINLKARRATRR
jgi:hypothetical protein